MTYLLFLILFLFIPIALMILYTARDRRALPPELAAFSPVAAILIHIVVALVYTTPWDNYLVATGVWWYNPELVLGITLGWVPIEEYTFFVVQSILTGLVVWALARHLPVNPRPAAAYPAARWILTGILVVLWLATTILFLSGWEPGTYLGIQGAWAILPMIIQAAFGGDILWRHRRLVGLGIGSMTLYLALTDSIALAEGTWVISPQQSFGILLGGVLPLEELTFFFATNVLLVWGITLLLARESHERLAKWRLALRRGSRRS